MEWTLISEDKPVIGERVLYCTDNGHVGITRKIVIGSKLGATGENADKFCAKISNGYSPNVIKWMKLPKG